jgi:hypothetical protein
MYPMIRSRLIAILLTAISASAATANEIYLPVAVPISPDGFDGVPPVEQVPGKEFTDSLDMTYVPTPHAVQPTQIGMFDGLGGAQDGLRLSDYAPNFGNYHIDAQSQIRDVMFNEVSANSFPLVVSTSFDQMLGGEVALASAL